MRRLVPIIAMSAAVVFVAACAPRMESGIATGARQARTTPAKQESVAASTPTTEALKQPTWGQSYKWPSGISVEIPPPTPCKPGKYAHPDNAPRAVLVTVKVTNGSDQPFETTVLAFGSEVQFNGATAETLFDSSGPCKSGYGVDSGTVLPGKSYTFTNAYVVGPQPGEMQIALEPDFRSGKAVFVGQA